MKSVFRLHKSGTRRRLGTSAFLTASLLFSPISLVAEDTRVHESDSLADSRAPFKQGAHCLFIGHSFFVPVARSFNVLASSQDFPAHRVEMVFAGGLAGTPGALWKNERRRTQIEDKLASGKIELLGMPVASPRRSSIEDYKKWIDTASKYNSETRFLIGHHWVAGGPRTSSTKYAQAIESGADLHYKIVSELRELYPDKLIYYISYGKTASLMKAQFEAGNLDDIEVMVGRGKEALFGDRFMGHAGRMMTDLCSLTWLNLLYGTKIEALTWRDYDKASVQAIAKQVLDFNEKYRVTPVR